MGDIHDFKPPPGSGKENLNVKFDAFCEDASKKMNIKAFHIYATDRKTASMAFNMSEADYIEMTRTQKIVDDKAGFGFVKLENFVRLNHINIKIERIKLLYMSVGFTIGVLFCYVTRMFF